MQEKCRILEHQQIAPHYFQLTLASAHVSANAKPGQFVQVRCSEKYDPLLHRPLSIHRISKKEKSFALLYEVVGKGTELLSQAKVGAELDVLGPLGNGFSIDKNIQTAILVGGGMGIAPLLSLVDKLKSENVKTIYALIGGKTKNSLLCVKDFKKLTAQVLLATDDGSCGEKGLVSDTLSNMLDKIQGTIYACGPRAMLKAVAKISAKNKLNCQVLMEARMACGIGTCLGCVIKTKAGYKKVCDDGPVFDSKEIIWQS
ncbi:hypothetical protein A3H38_05120 [candidate division WOR-1 bacterium RIFCSPLOWO2_02_FULL_46_20]|uniref:Dihydroorotate dehydrogenase B (NAD(+)), electron transfer subunit n=2 Tax=Saganbacteria TaxID=1703751 RepID=A0A1F4R4F6_UNCSA|nr:MAG: hypothetical protein A3H38_05120 [candidate division WOR-1 bacterium RIFCSPLOWO2_02_FULL_46_20]OGC09755.1 MAG: hypothetical protein A3F86_06010 [candidate division WOR-1 bacterium RIFCSPLOWO2_12_FULL_45_9]